MKFTNIPPQEEQHPHISKQSPPSILDNFIDYRLYNNLAIYIMKPGLKLNFKDMANIINNGKVATSWALRISRLNDLWVIHIAPHPDIDIDFNLYERMNDLFSKDTEINVLGHLHLGIIQVKNKIALEAVVNKLIEIFSGVELPGIESIPIDPQYKVSESDNKYKMPTYLQHLEKFDEPTYKKYLLIIANLNDTKALSPAESKDLIRISKRMFKNKVLIKSDLDRLNDFAERYLNTNKKIKIALQYLINK